MTLSFADDGTVTGTVFFGDGPALAPPTDPNVGYPPDVSTVYRNSNQGVLLEGFNFTVAGGTYAAPRVQTHIESNELWSQWCALQTSVPLYNDEPDGGCGQVAGYACASGVQITPSGCTTSSCQAPTPTPIDCGKAQLCDYGDQATCACIATGCVVRPGDEVSFDMQLTPGALNGSVIGLVVGDALQIPYNVHLAKQ